MQHREQVVPFRSPLLCKNKTEKMKPLFFHFVFVLFFSTGLHAAADSTKNRQPQRTLGLNFHYGSIFAHSKDVENTRYSRPAGIDLVYSKLKNDSVVSAICNCIPHTGFGVNYFNYDNAVLGHGFSAFYFLEPNFRINNALLWNIKGIVGFAAMTNPYDPQTNPTNMSYSLPFGAYIGVATGFNVRLSPALMGSVGGNYLHISNGGIKDPNLGINWITGNVALHYNLNNRFDFRKMRAGNGAHYSKFNRFDLGGFYSSKIVYIGDKKRYNVFGLSGVYSRQFRRLHAVTAGADWHIDYSLAEKQRRENAARDVHFFGTAIGHEFLLGKFIFSQQLGYYVKHPQPYYDRIYHRWGLNYRVKPDLHIGFSLKAHRHVAHFADIRLVYAINREIKK